jgi:subtilase family protein/fervidolysin-like protein
MRFLFQRGWVVLLIFAAISVRAGDTLVWKTNRVSADIKSLALPKLLRQIAHDAEWQIYLEPGATRNVSARFKNLPPGDALHLLLGELNFALVPQTNSRPTLYVFRTGKENATQLIQPADLLSAKKGKAVPNELIVTLKPGANIDDIARLLGAKVTGRLPEANAYRLQFDDQAAADAARAQLESNSNVTSVDSNYFTNPPPMPNALASGAAPQIQLNAKPANDGHVVIGLVDTAVQPLGNGLDAFLLKQISEAGNAQPDPGAPTHGTAMAETILETLQKINKGTTGVEILPIDVYGNSATTTTFDVAAGVAAAYNNGANVINLSLGSSGDSDLLHQIIQQVSAKGIPIFAAAGNDPTAVSYPGAYPETISVTALGQNGQIAPYANRDNYVDLAAPGTIVVPFGSQAFLVQGTSVSTPVVATLAAGWLDATHGSLNQMQSFLKSTFPVPASSNLTK